MLEGIRDIKVKKDGAGNNVSVRLTFGPHYFINLDRGPDRRVRLAMGATHHGFQADASEVNGELERIINEVRRAHPENEVD